MDPNKTLQWLWTFLLPHITRGLMWILAAKLGVDSASASSTAAQVAESLGMVVLPLLAAAWSHWQQGNKKVEGAVDAINNNPQP